MTTDNVPAPQVIDVLDELLKKWLPKGAVLTDEGVSYFGFLWDKKAFYKKLIEGGFNK